MKSLVIAFFFLCTIPHLQAQQYFEAQYPKVWERAAAYTHAVAEQMPEDQYGFRSAAGAMSFGEQLLHIVDNISFLAGRISGETRLFYNKADRENLSKAQIIDILETANQHVAELISGISSDELHTSTTFKDVEMTHENLFYLLRDHQVHHRGQCLVYMRMVEVNAPPYVGW
ncbi:DinB family protein [Rhodonellum sp.]|uniref:DinB family protein n=1 Tax=Rhodonellum sp. TaxID=2231180 RepID=UPI00271A207F|nr:DinB family protein [Rhodonellum sp.]MDO9554511.1 DinB family protein [Rhodonellum sp.]